jgi:hypothetical protein
MWEDFTIVWALADTVASLSNLKHHFLSSSIVQTWNAF